jgi:hypothetical protein
MRQPPPLRGQVAASRIARFLMQRFIDLIYFFGKREKCLTARRCDGSG